MMNGLTQQINSESTNRELESQLIQLSVYKKAFEEIEHEILFNASIGKCSAWYSMPDILNQIKKSNNINNGNTKNIQENKEG